MRVTVISGGELTAEDAARWSRFQAANDALVSPYFCPGFTRAVAAVRDDVRIAVLEDAGETIGYFPFQRERFGRGRPVGGPLSDYQGVVSARNDGWDAAALVKGARLKSWDFDHLVCAQTPFAPHHVATAESPVLDLSGGFDAYVAARRAAGSNLFARLDTLRRKCGREIAPLRFDAETKDAGVLRTLLGWKSEQCRRAGGVDVFAARWANALVERLLHTKEPDGFAGVLSALYAGDHLFAAHFGMRSSTVWHWWFPSYNHEFSKFSPGLMMLVDAAGASESLGIRTIDLGKGDSDYKQRTRSGGVPIAEGCVEIPSMVNRARRLRKGAERWVKASPLAAPARYPGRALKRFERWLRFQ